MLISSYARFSSPPHTQTSVVKQRFGAQPNEASQAGGPIDETQTLNQLPEDVFTTWINQQAGFTQQEDEALLGAIHLAGAYKQRLNAAKADSGNNEASIEADQKETLSHYKNTLFLLGDEDQLFELGQAFWEGNITLQALKERLRAAVNQ